MSNIKGIFFDAAGVFYDRREPTSRYATRLLKEKGFAGELSESNQARRKALRVQATEGRISHEAYWDQILSMYGVAAQNERAGLVKSILEHTHDVFAYPGGRETMAELKRRGFILGLITDTMYPVEWKMRWVAQAGVAEFIDVVACSTVLGAHKPDPAIYLNALVQARLAPAQAAFVGHAADELEGARQAGMVTVAVNYDPDAPADYYCKSLADLVNVPIFQRDSHNGGGLLETAQ
ncbi:MAG: HAD family hydrolase [Chloroflexota bacterium]|nr:HAD family hydrolase [Chloroflexota bacterium]